MLRFTLLFILLLLPAGLVAQESAPKVTRPDLATAYLRLDREVQARPAATDEETARRNQAFDRLTFSYFMGNLRAVVKSMNELYLSMQEEPTDARRLAVSLAVSPTPQVAVVGDDAILRVRSLYAPELSVGEAGEGTFGLTLRLRSGEEVIFERELEVASGDVGQLDRSFALEVPEHPGICEIELLAGGVVHYAGQWPIAAERPSEVRERTARRMAELSTELSDDLKVAAQIWRSRNELMTDSPESGSIAQLVVNPVKLAKDVAAELEKLAGGEDPYAALAGDSWQSLDLGEAQVAVRIVAPEDALASGKPLPLVIALHGAGGDENMFIEGYGAGRLTELAHERGFLLVSPNANQLGSKPRSFARLLDHLEAAYPVDPSRIYVVGHSMGAGLTGLFAGAYGDRLAACCCLAGGGQGFGGKGAFAPLLVIVPGKDRVVPPTMVRASARRAIDAGLPVEVREFPHHGHTLIVPDVMPEILDWFFERRLAGATPNDEAPEAEPPEEEPKEQPVPEDEDEFF